jgi:16S rRNA (cytosine1402-N4)-methyltransferase
MNAYHIPVLLKESVEGLRIHPDGIYVDATFGGGGHSREILKHLKKGMLVAFDQDPDSEANTPDDDRLIFLRQNFRYLSNNLRYLGIQEVDGILADLGVSSHQFDTGERGFSFRMEGPLDMRMNPDASKTAEEIIATYSEDELKQVFMNYGEVHNALKVAQTLIKERTENPIRTIKGFLEAIHDCVPLHQQNKYLARLFQALRIEVNREMENLKIFLEQSGSLLKKGGRMVVITYHSLEDRMVKHFLKTGNVAGERIVDLYGREKKVFKPVHRGVLTPGPEELQTNPRARSAKLRIAEKL